MKNSPIAVVLELVERIDPAEQRYALDPAIRRGDHGRERLARFDGRQTLDGHRLIALEAEALPAGPLLEHQRRNAHPDKVRAMDALVRQSDDGSRAQQGGPLRGPVPRRAVAVLD